jgi:multiple sugar transport system ATP-binding protein
MSAVSLEHVSKTYPNGVRALEDISLEVGDGELLVLAGPSGCGKTTTLRIIAGLESTSSGTVRIDNRIVNTIPSCKRDVAMVFQRPALYPHLSVRENLAFALRVRRRGSIRLAKLRDEQTRLEQGILAAARLVGVSELLNRLPVELSGGQQQRVAFGRAIIRRPRLFLLDEPLSHLDALFRAQLRQELHLLQRSLQTTMIYVTHDQTEGMSLADRLVIMDRGIIQQIDTPSVIYDAPRNRFVAGFVGSPPMNFLDGQLVRTDADLAFAAAGWSLPVPAEKVKIWLAHVGRNVTLGLRPHDVRIDEPADAGPGWNMEISRIEPLGRGSLVTFQRDGCRITCSVEDQRDGLNRTRARVSFRMERSYLFDRQTGECLSSGRPAG